MLPSEYPCGRSFPFFPLGLLCGASSRCKPMNKAIFNKVAVNANIHALLRGVAM
jgi:hypothetical protein